MTLKRVYKWAKHKRSESESRRSPSGGNTPSSPNSAQTIAPNPEPLASFLGVVTQPFAQRSLLPLSRNRQEENWPNLAAFSRLLNQSGAFGPLAGVIDDLQWFIKAHENMCTSRQEYQTLRVQLEGLCADLRDHFSSGAPPRMTTSMRSLCRAIHVELMGIYGTQERDAISRYMQANQDLDKITGCYRRIQGHLERVMFNASMNILKLLDKQGVEAQLDRLAPSMAACYDSRAADVVQRRECTPNTRQRVLQDLKAWKDNPHSEKVCWINGMAGTGKTTITNTLCSSLDTTHELGASFFCTRLIPSCRDVELILPTIAYQLARFSSPFRGELLQVLDRDPDVHTKVLRVQFRRMILEPLRGVMCSLPNNIVVVIDALDECDNSDGVKQVLEVLLEHASELPIKFLVSSRPEYHIREKIRKSTLKTQLVLHELDEKVVKADIETYLRAELASTSAPPTPDQLLALVERAGTLFIYAATVVRYIKCGHTTERLAVALSTPRAGHESKNKTKEIDRLYETVLTSALENEDLEQIERERMELVLHTVVCAQEPLTVGALAGLLHLEPTQVTDALEPLWSVLHISESNSAHQVSTLHASFPDYMLDSKRSKQFACNAPIHNGMLAELCFQRIERHRPQFNICGLQSSYVFDDDVQDIGEKVNGAVPMDLLYACLYWAIHLNLGDGPAERDEMLHKFLSNELLLWMEVLNLNKRIDKGIALIETAISWLKATNHPGTIIALARDARRFLTTFATSPISRATPHLYVSMLASWPAYQPTAYCYGRQTHGLVSIKGSDKAERQLSLLTSIPVESVVFCVSYSSNGTFFAAGTTWGTVLIWDTVSCRMTIDPINAHNDILRALAISPDGSQVCSCSHDQTLRIWDSQSGQPVADPLEGHTNWVASVEYSPDSSLLASGSYDGTVRIWSTHNWQMKGSPLEGYDGFIFSVSFSPNGSIVVAGSKSMIHLWDPLSGQKIGESLKGHTGYVTTLAFLPNGQYLISGSMDRTVRVWDLQTGQPKFEPIRGHLAGITSVVVSPNGDLVASAAEDNTMRIWDTQTWQVRALFQQGGVVRSVRFSPDGSRLLSGSVDDSVRVWEVPDILDRQVERIQSEGHSGRVQSVAFSPCGSYVVSGSSDMTVRIWSTQDGRPLNGPLKGHNAWILSVGISPDGNEIYSISADRIIHVWDRQAGRLNYSIGPIETDGNNPLSYQETWPVDFRFDGRRIVCGSQSGRIYMWEDSMIAFELNGHNSSVYSIAFSPDGKSFISGSEDGELMMWDASSGKQLLGPFIGHLCDVYSVAFSPDGSLVASGSRDTTIRLWSTDTGLPVCDPLEGHTQTICSVSFSLQGKHLVSGSDDMSVRVWDVVGGRCIANLRGHTNSVCSVVFSPDETQIVSGSADVAIRIWDAPHHKDTPANDSGLEPSVTERDPRSSWMMDDDGWVKDDEQRLLFWVPADLRSILLRPQNPMLISRQGCVELDISEAKIGEEWHLCYRPFPTSTTD